MASLSSPRVRRRLKWLTSAVALAAGVALVVVLIPSHGPAKPVLVTTEGLAKLATPTSTHVAAADRRAIDRVLDRFIPAAVGRSDARTAYRLAGPEMKVSTSYADWRAWNVPVPSYPAKGTTFHDWTTLDAGRDYVDFNLLLHPRPGHADLGDWVLDGQMVRAKGSWRVNRLYTIAINHPVRGSKHEIGPADFLAPAASGTPAGKPRLGHAWFLVAAGVMSLVLVVPLAFGVLGLRRRRRWRARIKAEHSALPPLRPTGERPPDREPAGRH